MKRTKIVLLTMFIAISLVMMIVRVPSTRAASQLAINTAIEKGLAYLNGTQAADGHWGNSYYPVACTATAVLAFENAPNNHYGWNLSDPYHTAVQKGLNYLFTQAHVQALSMQPAGNPDSGNGIGIYFGASETVYQTPMVLMAIIASQDQTQVATTGPVNVNGRSYHEIAVDIVDWIAYAQNEFGSGRGGWRYTPNYNSSDNSNTQWPLLGLMSAELWGISAPAWVKSELLRWLAYSQNMGGNYNSNSLYGSFGYSNPNEINDIAETATGILGLTYCDIPKTDPRIIAAQGFIVREWNKPPNSWKSNFGNLYGMYGVMKACRLAEPTPIINIANYTNSPTIEWYNGTNQYADWLIANQYGNGHWHTTTGGFTPHDDLSTAWGVLILEYVPVVVKYTLTVNVVDAFTDNPIPGADVSITGPETHSGTTDGGAVEFSNIQAGSYQVTASKMGYDSSTAQVNLIGNTTITMRLIPLQQVIPEVPWGTIIASVSMAMALFAYVAISPRRNRKL